MFRFATPQYLYLLLLIPVFIGAFVYALRRRQARLNSFGNRTTIAGLMPDVSMLRVRHKFVLFLVALTFAVFALARPQFGTKLKEVKHKGVEMMIAVDVSNSMLAQDFEPNRLERTKYSINRLLEELDNDMVGLIAFAGDAYIQLPITTDYITAAKFVEHLSPDMVSRQGTSIGAAISLATTSFSSQSEGSRVIIIISDGENHEDDALAVAEDAAKQGIKIYTIGVGTPGGAPIQVNGDFLKDDKGEMVVTKLDEQTLRQIALTTGGAYIRADKKSMGLNEIVDQINKMEQKEFETKVFEEYDEQYSYLLAVALLILIFEFTIMPFRNPLFDKFNIFSKR